MLLPAGQAGLPGEEAGAETWSCTLGAWGGAQEHRTRVPNPLPRALAVGPWALIQRGQARALLCRLSAGPQASHFTSPGQGSLSVKS